MMNDIEPRRQMTFDAKAEHLRRNLRLRHTVHLLLVPETPEFQAVQDALEAMLTQMRDEPQGDATAAEIATVEKLLEPFSEYEKDLTSSQLTFTLEKLRRG